MKKLLAVLIAAAMLTGLSACLWFGENDNPPMALTSIIEVK